MRHQSDPTALGEMAYPAEDDCDGEWEEAHAVGHAKGQVKARGKGKYKAHMKRYGENLGQQRGKGPQGGTWGHEDPDHFLIQGPQRSAQRKCQGKWPRSEGRLWKTSAGFSDDLCIRA